jgi:hypothetical protein
MTNFQSMYDEGIAAGLTKDQMRDNCQKQLEQYERIAAERDEWESQGFVSLQTDGDLWRAMATKCREMLKWLDAK